MSDRLRLGGLLVATVVWVVAVIILHLPLIVAMLGLAVLITYTGRAYNTLDDHRQLHDHSPSEGDDRPQDEFLGRGDRPP
jgi:hypothetical protein